MCFGGGGNGCVCPEGGGEGGGERGLAGQGFGLGPQIQGDWRWLSPLLGGVCVCVRGGTDVAYEQAGRKALACVCVYQGGASELRAKA